MIELLIVLFLTPLFFGLSDTMRSLCSGCGFTNPLSPYINLFLDLRENNFCIDRLNPFAAISLGSVIISAFILFNISINLDFLIFACLMLLVCFCFNSFLNTDIRHEIVKICTFIITMFALYIYTNNPVFETLHEIHGINQFIPYILAVIFLFLSVYNNVTDIKNFCTVDRAFFNYASMLSSVLFIAMFSLLFYSENLLIFSGFMIAGSLMSGGLRRILDRYSLVCNILLILLSIVFAVLVIKTIH